MNQIETLSFWTPIVPNASEQTSAKEWVRWQADHLLSFGHHIYRLDANDVVRLEEAPVRSKWETIKKVIFLATLILPVVAFIIKKIDRYTHQYKLFVPSPLDSDLNQPMAEEEEVDANEAPASTVDQDSPPTHSPVSPRMEEKTPTIEALPQKPQDEKNPIQQATPPVVHPQTVILPPSKDQIPLDEIEAQPITQIPKRDSSVKVQEKEKIKAEKLQKAKEEELAKEEKAKKQLEYNRTCHKVAELFFPKMLEMYYEKDGSLNNLWGKQQVFSKYWDVRVEQKPELLFEKAEQLELAGDTDGAQKCRAEALAGEKERKAYIENKVQKTFFPHRLQDGTLCNLDELLKECTEEFTDREFFHRTTKERALLIEKNGFEPFWPAGNRILDTGYGAYLALDQEQASGADKQTKSKEDALLKVKFQPKGKIALYNAKIHTIIENCFRDMGSHYATSNNEDIYKALQNEKCLPSTTQENDVETWLAVSTVGYALACLFTTNFFERNGFRGVYAQSSHRAGKNYLNLFHPKDDIVSITQV